MNFDNKTLEVAHKHSSYNQRELLESESCGCFYCLQIFKPNEIQEWIDEDNPKGFTAICPYCNIDSILGDKSGYPVKVEFLKAMFDHWFK